MTFETAAFYTTVAVIGTLVECVFPGVGVIFAASAIVARKVS
jgi:hypothetical protein